MSSHALLGTVFGLSLLVSTSILRPFQGKEKKKVDIKELGSLLHQLDSKHVHWPPKLLEGVVLSTIWHIWHPVGLPSAWGIVIPGM